MGVSLIWGNGTDGLVFVVLHGAEWEKYIFGMDSRSR